MQELQMLRKQVLELTEWREAVLAHAIFHNLEWSLTDAEGSLNRVLDFYVHEALNSKPQQEIK